MTTSTYDAEMGEMGLDTQADSPSVDSGDNATATEGDTSGGETGDKYVPYSRFKEVIDERNSDRKAFNELRSNHEQLLSWVHQEAVPKLNKIDQMGEPASSEEEYVDPLEKRIIAQEAELKQLREAQEQDRQSAYKKEFNRKVDLVCKENPLASPAEIMDAFLKNPTDSFDFKAAAKRSHETALRKADMLYKKRGEVSKAKKLIRSTPASLAAEKKPQDMKDARELARAFFRNQQQ